MSQAVLDRELNECLCVELGWKDVAKGLTKILVGYGIWVGGNLFGLMLVLMPLFAVGFKMEEARLKVGQLWMFYAGLGILSVAGIFACGVIMGGKWRCILNAPERNACRWLMFLCLASMAMSLALSLLSSLSGVKVQPEFSRGVVGLGQLRFTTAGVIFNLASVGLSMAYVCSFALFLRSVAQCMASRWHVRMVDLFLSFFVPLTLASVFLIYKLVMGDQHVIKPLLMVGVGWFLCFLYWLTIIALVRSCILKTVERVREPMAYMAMDQASLEKRRHSYSEAR
jgi:hypothetical protein